ncbi:hypothetical protein [Bradyrhizobium sp. USDA 4529]
MAAQTITKTNRKKVMAKVPLSAPDLQAHLDEQMGFLEWSAKSLDEGYEDEAKRLAVTLRVLLHETSLLGQLSSLDRSFPDTSVAFDPPNLARSAADRTRVFRTMEFAKRARDRRHRRRCAVAVGHA